MKIRENSVRINGLVRPVIDSVPQFSWKLIANENGKRQDAYRIVVSASSDFASPIWDTGFVTSEECSNIRYAGDPLLPMTRYYLSLTVRSEGELLSCMTEYFDTGKCGIPFSGIWITGHFCLRRDEALAAPYLRRTFRAEKKIGRAMLYLAGLGYFEARINGEKVGNDFLSTAYTAYDKRILYRAFDVTNMLHIGENALGVILGNGFYNCFTEDPWQSATAPWRDVPKLLCDLVLEYEDGTRKTVKSDSTWKSHTGPITFNGIRHGETYDARLEMDGWDMPEFDDSDWKAPRRAANPGAELFVMEMEPIRIRKRFPAMSKKKVPEGWLFDIGQNQAGVCLLTFRGKRGDKITVRYCDRLTEDGRLDQAPLACFIKNYSFQTDTYIKRTDEPETWHARFTYHGYQWVEISGSREEPQLSDVTALSLCNDFAVRGEFFTSSETINKIQSMCLAATTSCCMNTFVSDTVREKSSWTGDTGLSVEQLLINFAAEPLMKKWQQDLRDAERPCGSLPCIVPSPGWGYNGNLNGPDWSAPMWEVPWQIYQSSGDLSVLRDNYSALCRFVSWLDSMSEDGIAYGGLGDWCAPFDGPAISVNMESFRCPVAVTDTAYYYNAVMMAAASAELLGLPADVSKYKEKASYIRSAFRTRFYDEKTHTVSGNCQTATAVMIYYGLAKSAEIPALLNKLEEQIDACGGHLDFGVLGMKAVLNVLGIYGKTELALKMIANPTYPSYAHWLTLGANTLWECWNGGGSRNHHMFSDVSAFFYKYIAGITAAAPGYRNVTLRPAVNCGLEFVHATIDTPLGVILCEFRKKNGKTTLEIEIPVGCEATLSLPGTSAHTLHSGRYHIQMQS